MSAQLEFASQQSKQRFKVTRTIERRPVIRNGITFIEPVKIETWSCVCRVCQKSFDPYEPGLYAEQHQQGFCGEDCWASHLHSSGQRGTVPSYAKLRAPTSDRNLRQRGVERQSLASISAERQRRIDEVKRRFEAGESPTDISKAMGHTHTLIYKDLYYGGCEIESLDERRDRFRVRIKELIKAGWLAKDIAADLEISPAAVSRYLREMGIDGRRRGVPGLHRPTYDTAAIVRRAIALDDGRPRSEIAKELGVKLKSLNNWLRKAGHSAPPRGRKLREQIKVFLRKGNTYAQIQAATGASISTIAATKKEINNECSNKSSRQLSAEFAKR